MKKLWLIIIATLVLLPIAWYFVSPLFIVVEVDEASPLIINDAMDTMDTATKAEFNEQVANMQDIVVQTNDDMPIQPRIVSTGEFQPRAHEVEGRAIWIENNEMNIIRFEDFETVNGPNLHIYLFSDLSSNDYIDLGQIKATKGNVNYEIPEHVNLEKYNKVAVWCVPFRVLFSYAELE